MKFHNLLLLIVSWLFCLLLVRCTSSPAKLNPSNEDWRTPFERDSNYTATYTEAIGFYEQLAKASPSLDFQEVGETDSGKPLHLAVLSTDGDFDPVSLRQKGKRILMINNAIHAGEPCGVDATMMWLRDLLQNPTELLDNTVIIAIPMYNIGGVLNRNSHSRANQNGPSAYGFRGNARNLDLNRDFIKCDSKNAQSFNRVFSKWQPDVLIDNHTSNGADYQYTITLIATQHNKLDAEMAGYMNTKMLPELYAGMAKTKWEMTPYVFVRNTPDEGIAGFLDLPRYSSGYAALYDTWSFMPETHMFKPFAWRVRSVYTFMGEMLTYLDHHGEEMAQLRKAAKARTASARQFDLNWEIDLKQGDSLLFKGYTADVKTSKVTGQDRMYYDHERPYKKAVPFFNSYKTTLQREVPAAYIIPQAYQEVIDRLRWNGVQLFRLTEDTRLAVTHYRIGEVQSRESPYEGHYLHTSVKVDTLQHQWKHYAGDYVVIMDQAANRYIVSCLEPQAPDSYFAWNFFDGILMQKEYFSSYVFEDKAAEYLALDPGLKSAFEAKKKADGGFAKDSRAQLDFIYKRTPHYEPTHRLYPVGRLDAVDGLPLERE